MKILLIIEVLVLITWNFGRSPTDPWNEKVDKTLLQELQKGGTPEFLITLKAQGNIQQARQLKTKDSKGHYVVEQLRQTARSSQSELRRILNQYGAPYRSFYLVNAIWSRGSLALVRRLAQQPEVRQIQYNPSYTFHRPFPSKEAGRRRDGVEWGIRRIKADQVWAMGFRGEGAVIAGADTGYDWRHPTLNRQYRGWNNGAVDHRYNWHDAIHQINPLHQDSIVSPDLNPCGLDTSVPCDDHGHGTHTMGTMLGDDGQGNQIGVAPKAQWIGCRNMERGFGSPATYIECFEWLLGPTDLDGNDPDPGRAPHVINNSWGCPPFEGCNPDNFNLMERAIAHLRAAGIVVVSSAGNGGRRCNTIDDPAAIFADVFSVGATGRDDTVAVFSSRGPVTVDSSQRLKPNVAAPGVSIRSALPDSTFATWNGTSMAGPHVAGVVALMISANPEIAGQVDLIEDILEQSAKPMADTAGCGDIAAGIVPNNAYGFGRIDALAAVQRVMELTDLEDIGTQVQISTFPNPFSETLTFIAEGWRGRATLEIFNVAGKRLFQKTWQMNSTESSATTVALPGLPPGAYFYQLSGDHGLVSGKLIRR